MKNSIETVFDSNLRKDGESDRNYIQNRAWQNSSW